MLDFHLARFAVNATPPLGHPLCGGWIKEAVAVDDPLQLRGVVIEGAGLPIVLAALDWTGVLNDSHRVWTEALAEAARTTPDRVALHCAHQHNAPFVDHRGNVHLEQAGAKTRLQDDAFFDAVVRKSAEEVRKCLSESQPITELRAGSAEVEQVASNRRVLGDDGKIKYVRYSSTKDEAIRAAPEGTIDPVLKSISFRKGDRVLARLYYYTTHPMSYYGDGRVSSDFVGLARNERNAGEPEALHLYFTGCAGNITAGKYNDGAHENRQALAKRVLAGMKKADADGESHTHKLESIAWKTSPILFRPREDLNRDALAATIRDDSASTTKRHLDAMTLSWLERLETKRPILLGRLDLGPATILHLPAETFVEYQLAAQVQLRNRTLATAAYGDGGPWYIPLARSFNEGGYEPSVSLTAKDTEPQYRQAIRDLLAQA